MLHENIRTLRKAEGLSQQELAAKLNVVRQTVSKWERGLSVPDSEMLVALSEVLETPVSTLLKETVRTEEAEDLQTIAARLEIINLQLAQRKDMRRRIIRGLCLGVGVVIVIVTLMLAAWKSPYLAWNYRDPETAVLGVLVHGGEWVFVRVAPLVLIAAWTGVFLTRRKK